MSSEKTRDGITIRGGRVTPEHPVRGHVHPNGHWLICTGAEGSGMALNSQKIGERVMRADDEEYIDADDVHALSVVTGWATYKCVGKAPL